MIRRSRGWHAVAVLGVAGLALAACGGDDADPDAADASVPVAEDTAGATDGGSEDGAAAPAEGDGTLTIGTLLPETGNLAFLGPPEFAGVQLAVNEINEAGGVLGNDVVKIDGDSGDTTTDVATQTVTRLLGEDVDAIIGAASSGVSFTVIDQITNAGVVHFSPANTSPDFTDYDDNGLYFRTAPSDVLQGRVLGDLLVQDGYLDVAIMALDDPYGSGLAENVTQSLEAGGGSVAGGEPIVYDPAASNFSAEVTEVANSDAEALVLIGFAETSQIILELIAQGVGPQDLPVYLVDGNLANYGDELPAGSLEGTKGTLPGAEVTGDLQERLLEVNPALDGFPYAPESYDATITVALAAAVAGSDAGTAIAAELPGVTRDGEQCTTFADCMTLVEAGEDIDYDGASGPIELSDAGDPTQATIGVYQFGPDNTYTALEYLSGTL